MKNGITEVVFILDRSGSMSGYESDTVGGFNATVEKQKRLEGVCYVSTVLFDGKSEILHDRVRLEEVKPLTERDYSVGGNTALLDAVGGAIRHIDTVHRYIREEDVPEHTIFVITTDGMENASREFTRAEVKRMIEAHRELGWEFIFLAANIDAGDTAESIGIKREHSAGYRQSAKGFKACYSAMSKAVGSVRCGGLDEDWRSDL
ncbi:MAG: VWA domain-containing protein [Clostridia bacterium]|nr:VWA domain-containing protein [Clostridia bacterium]